MPVDVKKITDRRAIHYNSLQEFQIDAERLAAGPVRMLGNKSYAEILGHLALVMNNSINVSEPRIRFSWFLRIVARLLRKQILARGLRPGFRLSADADAKVWPRADDVNAALEGLRKAIHRLATETKRGAHPAFGKLTVDEWNQFHLCHAKLHMSFVVPA